jgi:hypothetical protein
MSYGGVKRVTRVEIPEWGGFTLMRFGLAAVFADAGTGAKASSLGNGIRKGKNSALWTW